MDRRAQQFTLPLDGPSPPKGRVQTDLPRMLATPLSNKLLGVEVGADIYARNGFRLIGAPACANKEALESQAQRFRSLFRLDPAAAVRSAIQTGYDGHVRLDHAEINEALARLYNPRWRVLCELFWPHVGEEMFAPLKRERRLAATPVLTALAEVSDSRNGREGALAAHALAVLYHNRALAHEAAFAAGEAEWSDEHWNHALGYWAIALGADSFWDYWRERIGGFDDPRVKPDDVAALRAQLPLVVLGFNALLARAYGQAGAVMACRRHLAFIRLCGLPEAAKQEVLRNEVKLLAATGLEPLNRRADKLLEGEQRNNYQRFKQDWAPLLDEAEALRFRLCNDLGLPPAVAASAEFDSLCDRVLRGVDRKINYSNDDCLRAILYASLTTKRLLGWPVSTDMRRRLERTVRTDTETLYSEFQPANLDHTRCWFVEGEAADPEASIELPVYKITRREVQVNYPNAGVHVSFAIRRVLVPRSTRAKAIHEGKLKAEDISENSLDAEGQALLARIRQAEAQCQATVEREQQASDAEVKQEEAALTAALAQYDQRVAPEIKAAQQELEAAEQRRQHKVREAKRRRDRAAQEANQLAIEPIAQAQNAHAAVVERNRGLRGGKQLEAPALVVAGVLGGIGGLALTLGGILVGTPLTAAGSGLLLGLIAGFILCRLIRFRRVAAAKWAVRSAERARQSALDRIEAEFREKTEQFAGQLKQETAETNQRLTTIKVEREQLVSQCRQRQEQIRRRHEQNQADARKTAQSETQKLRRQLLDRVKSKPLSAKTDFPAYRQAKTQGFKDGKEPSDAEMRMTYAEEQEARRRLGIW